MNWTLCSERLPELKHVGDSAATCRILKTVLYFSYDWNVHAMER